MSEPRKRPTRACTAKTPSRLAPLAPTVERSTPQKKQTGGNEEPNVPLVFSIPAATPADKDRWDLRSMWELASVINFFNTFRPILRINEFTAEELETALLTCNSLLMDIHVALLKGIHPSNRNSITKENWVTCLHKKLKDRWMKVAELPFPLAGCQGDEAAVYKGFDPPTRLIILRAVCEIRLDQDDVRAYMEEPVKKGHVSSFRKERSGANSVLGTIYWFENDLISGHRLYREILKPKGKEFRGRAASPPPPSQWETLASNLDEFQSVADTLLSSKSRQETGLGKKLKQEVIPVLEAIQKKKERVLKRQQRQASLLDSALQENGLAGGRAKRDRKPVTYTFDEYDKSINEAIKFTRKRTQSPERAAELTNGHGVANGHTDQLKKAKSSRKERLGQSIEKEPFTIVDDSDEHEHSEPQESTSDIAPELSEGAAASSDRESSDGVGTQNFGRRIRRRTRSLRYSESDYVDSAYAEEDDLYSDDEIEGEAIYDEEFLRNRKRRRGYASSADEEYRADEDDEEDAYQEDDLDEGSYSEEEQEQEPEEDQEHEVLPRSRRKARKSKAVEDLGLRRSKRATRSKVNYKAYEDSELEEDDDYPPEQPRSLKQNGEQKASASSFEEDADYSMESGSHPSSNETSDREDQAYTSKAAVAAEQEQEQQQQQQNEEEQEEEENDEVKRENDNHMNGGDDDLDRKQQLRFLDLNECAPADSPRDWMTSLKSIGFLDDGGDITPREELV